MNVAAGRTAHIDRARHRQRASLGEWTRSSLDSESAARALGWVSVGLGLTALLAPRKLGELTGLGDRTALLRLVGGRELMSGAKLLTHAENPAWTLSRVLGDLMDLALLADAAVRAPRRRSRAVASLAVVTAIAAVDFSVALRRSRMEGLSAPDLYLERSLLVNKSPQECYAFWRDIANLPRFFAHLQSVDALDERRTHWTARLPGGGLVQWDSEVTADLAGQRLQWRTLTGAPFPHAATVNFEPAPGKRGTLLSLSVHYRSRAKGFGSLLAQWLGPDPLAELLENLRRFKQLIETGEIPTTHGQSAGRRSLMGRWVPEFARRLRQPPAPRNPARTRPAPGVVQSEVGI